MLFVIIAFLLIVGALLLYLKKKREYSPTRLLWLGLFCLAILAAYLWKEGVDPGATARFVPLYKLFHYEEYGRTGVLNDLLDYGLPFLPMGLLFLAAFPGMGVGRAALGALLAALIFHIPAVIGGSRPFILDEYFLATLGGASGAGLGAIILSLTEKSPLPEKLGLPRLNKPTFRAGTAVCAVVYFGIAILLIVDYFGFEKSELSLFESSVSLPANAVSEITFTGDEPRKVSVYRSDAAALDQRTLEIAAALGMEGELHEASGAYMMVDENSNSLMMEPSGAWTYERHGAGGDALPALEEAETAARAFFEANPIPGVTLGTLTDSMALRPNIPISEFDPAGDMSREEYDALKEIAEQVTGYRLYFATTMDGYRLRNGNELLVTVGPGGNVTKIQAMGASLSPVRNASILKAEQAFDRVLSGELKTHTLFSPASSVTFTGYDLVYFADSISGEWLPAWAFQGTALLEDGSASGFEAYVPAEK